MNKGIVRHLKFSLRLFSGLQFLSAAAFITFGCLLQFPPKDALVISILVVGVLSVIAALLGFCASSGSKCFIWTYITFGGLLLASQTGLVAYLFIDPQVAIDQLDSSNEDDSDDTSSSSSSVDTIVTVGRWVLLAFVGAQIIGIVLAAVLRCCTRHTSYEEFQETEAIEYEQRKAKSEAQLEKLKSKVYNPSSTGKDKKFISMTRQMSVGRDSAIGAWGSGGGNNGRGDVENGNGGGGIGAIRATPRSSAPSMNNYNSSSNNNNSILPSLNNIINPQNNNNVSSGSAWVRDEQHGRQQPWRPTWQQKANEAALRRDLP